MEYVEPRVIDYGSLADMTAADVAMRHFGFAAAAASTPLVPGSGGVDPGVSPDTVGPPAAGPAAVDPGGAAPADVGGEGVPAGGEPAGDEAGPGGTAPADVEGSTGAPGAGGDELPFTGFGVAATAATGAASVAAGLGLRAATDGKGSARKPREAR